MSMHRRHRLHAVLSWHRECWSIFLWSGNLLAASFFVRGHTAWWITLRDRASWVEDTVLTRRRWWRSVCYASRHEGGVLMRRWQRRSVSYITHGWRWARQREGWCRRASSSADKLGDAVQLVLVEVGDQAVTRELICHEQRSLRVRGCAAGVRG